MQKSDAAAPESPTQGRARLINDAIISWMDDSDTFNPPSVLDAIRADTERLGFTMASEPKTGSLLRTLAAMKPGGRFLELGTGTGIGTAWILAGMDSKSRLDTVDNDAAVQGVARRHLKDDSRVTFHLADGAAFLAGADAGFDLIYADSWPGKFSHLDAALALLRTGGIYLIDDLLPQPNWPEGHAPKVPALIADLERRKEFTSTKLAWASGLMLVVRL
jgi:predicted O-methyltransferase YrrM